MGRGRQQHVTLDVDVPLFGDFSFGALDGSFAVIPSREDRLNVRKFPRNTEPEDYHVISM